MYWDVHLYHRKVSCIGYVLKDTFTEMKISSQKAWRSKICLDTACQDLNGYQSHAYALSLRVEPFGHGSVERLNNFERRRINEQQFISRAADQVA